MIKQEISRAQIAAQCTRHCATLVLRCPPPSSICNVYHPNQLLYNSVIDVIFQPSFAAIIVIAFLFVPHNLLFMLYISPSLEI